MTVKVTRDAINLREKLSELDKPSGIAGEAILRADTPQEVFNYIGAGRRNLIINGAMQVAQRGTSFGPTSTSQYTVDRWYLNTSSETCTVTQESFTAGQTDVPQAQNYLRLVVTTTNTYAGLVQRIEDVERLGGQTVTLSFYARGGQGGQGIPTTFRTYLNQNFGSGGSTGVNAGLTNHTLTSSWQKFTSTISIPSVAGKTIGASSFTEVYFQQTTGEACDFDIALVQLEVGSVATPFEHRSYGEELALCQRYYEVSGDEDRYSANVVNAQSYYFSKQFNVSKRTSPTITLQTNSVDNLTLAANSATTSEQHAGFSVVATATDGRANVEFQWQADAEL